MKRLHMGLPFKVQALLIVLLIKNSRSGILCTVSSFLLVYTVGNLLLSLHPALYLTKKTPYGAFSLFFVLLPEDRINSRHRRFTLSERKELSAQAPAELYSVVEG